jgi:hypothetical protein
VRFLFESGDESAGSLQCHVEIVDAEEQEEAVARRRLVRAHQGGMLVRAPLMEAEQDGSIEVAAGCGKIAAAFACCHGAEKLH